MPGYMNNQFLTNSLDTPNTDLYNPTLLRPRKVANSLGTVPELPGVPATGGDNSFLGLSPMAVSSTLAGLGTAIAPIRYDKRGNKIETWQGNVGKVLGDMFRAQQMAQALNSGDGANPGVNKMLLSLLLGGGK